MISDRQLGLDFLGLLLLVNVRLDYCLDILRLFCYSSLRTGSLPLGNNRFTIETALLSLGSRD